MPSIIYYIFAYMLLGVQIGIAPYLSYRGAAPNLGLVAVLFLSLNGKRDGARLGSLFIGLTQDLLTAQQPGLYAFSYGIIAAMLVGFRRSVNINRSFVQVVLCLAAAAIIAIVVLTHELIHPTAQAYSDGSTRLGALRLSFVVEFYRVIYTAAVSPFILAAGHRIRNVFMPQLARRNW